jgi:hypothetical protein
MTEGGGPGMQTGRSRARRREGGGAVERGREAVCIGRWEVGVCVCWTDAHVDCDRVVESGRPSASSLDSIQANAMEGLGFGVSKGMPVSKPATKGRLVSPAVRPKNK